MIVGIDLGGTNIAAGLVDHKGHLHHKIVRPTEAHRGFEAVATDMAEMIEELTNEAVRRSERIASIGIGIPGIADPETGVVRACVNLNWIDRPLGAFLRRRFPLPIYIDNDATVASAAEFIIGQQGIYRNAVLLTLGTGVGSGLVIDGKIHSGSHGIGAEVGHMIVGDNFYECNCGRSGCLETFASSSALIRYAQKLLDETVIPSSLRHTAPLDGESIFRAAKVGDELANRVVQRMTRYLAVGIMNLVSVLDPEAVLLGGGLAMAGTYLVDRVVEQLETLRYFHAAPLPEIRLAKLQNDAGIIGAAIYAQLK